MKDWTLTEWLGVVGFGLAVLGLGWQFVTWRLQYRIKLKVAVFMTTPPDGARRLVIEAANLNHDSAVQVRHVRLEFEGKSLGFPPIAWMNPPRIEPLGLFQAALAIPELEANGWNLPGQARGCVTVANGKTFRSKTTYLQ